MRKTVKVSILDEPSTYSHEMSHMIDNFFGERTNLGFQWNSRFATKKEGKYLTNLFNSSHSKKIGTYTNGDGCYFKGNWLDIYEGRIYNKSRGVGEEWWAMNMERYGTYRAMYNDIIGYSRYKKRQRRFALNSKRKFQAEIDEVQKSLAKEHKDSQRYVGLKREIEVLKENRDVPDDILSRKEWAENGTLWRSVQFQYPKLAEFIENKFGGDFIL